MIGDYTSYTPAAVAKFPYWKQLCFSVMRWNRTFNPHSIDEWYARFKVFGITKRELEILHTAAQLHEKMAREVP